MDYPGLLKWKCIYHDHRKGKSRPKFVGIVNKSIKKLSNFQFDACFLLINVTVKQPFDCITFTSLNFTMCKNLPILKSSKTVYKVISFFGLKL